jgi:hypothetical protein
MLRYWLPALERRHSLDSHLARRPHEALNPASRSLARAESPSMWPGQLQPTRSVSA